MKAPRRVGVALGLFACSALFPVGCARERAPESTAAAPAASVAPTTTPSPAPSLPSSLTPDIGAMDAATAVRLLADTTRQLDDTLELAAPDCGAAGVLRDRICALSARICRLAAENSTDRELSARCDDAKPRCARAKTRVAGPCG
jgi:hypothetical protein